MDHRNDPFELKNLANDPEHEQVVNRLMTKLNAWLKQQGDVDPVKTEMDALNRVNGEVRERAITRLKKIGYPGFE